MKRQRYISVLKAVVAVPLALQLFFVYWSTTTYMHQHVLANGTHLQHSHVQRSLSNHVHAPKDLLFLELLMHAPVYQVTYPILDFESALLGQFYFGFCLRSHHVQPFGCVLLRAPPALAA